MPLSSDRLDQLWGGRDQQYAFPLSLSTVARWSRPSTAAAGVPLQYRVYSEYVVIGWKTRTSRHASIDLWTGHDVGGERSREVDQDRLRLTDDWAGSFTSSTLFRVCPLVVACEAISLVLRVVALGGKSLRGGFNKIRHYNMCLPPSYCSINRGLSGWCRRLLGRCFSDGASSFPM